MAEKVEALLSVGTGLVPHDFAPRASLVSLFSLLSGTGSHNSKRDLVESSRISLNIWCTHLLY